MTENTEKVACHAEEVNGLGTGEVAGYVPTRCELIQLVKYWYREYLGIQWVLFTYGHKCSTDFRCEYSAKRRIALAEKAIGEAAVERAIKEARGEFKAEVNDARLWDIFENGTAEQREGVQEETCRGWREQDAAETLNRLEQLQSESPGGLIVLVLHDWPDDKGRPVLVAPTDSELNAVLQASGEFEVETDKSKLRTLMVEQGRANMGFLRAKRQEGDWRFEFLDSRPGTNGWHFLERVTGQIRELLHDNTEKESRPV